MSEILVFTPMASVEGARTLLAGACQSTGTSARLEVFGSSGSLFQRLRARRAPPPPDLVLWWGPYAAHSAALDGLLQPYHPANVPTGVAHDAEWRWLAVDFQAPTISGDPPLSTFQDLGTPQRLAIADPERSEAGMMAVLGVLDRARQQEGDAEQGWAWWQRRMQAGLALADDEMGALEMLRERGVTHALTFQARASPITGLAPLPHAIGLPASARNVESARKVVDWLVSEAAHRPGSLSLWQATANGLRPVLEAAPPLDVDWGTRQYATVRTRWARSGFGPALTGL
jgi:ABC-type Fe3+ transport system substrate-binding protein